MTLVDIHVDIHEAFDMLVRITGALNPEGMFAHVVSERLTAAMHTQQSEMFDSQGNGEWAQLSDWRVRDRGTSMPILQDTGSFRSKTNEFVGMWSATPETFTYIYPALFQEEAGKYFGITAGQRHNPLAKTVGPRGGQGEANKPIPMKQVPRPILFGETRMYADVQIVFREWLTMAGFVDDGIGGE